MSEFDKVWVKAVAGFIASYVVIAILIGLFYVPDLYWQMAWQMIRGAAPFVAVIIVGLVINQRIKR